MIHETKRSYAKNSHSKKVGIKQSEAECNTAENKMECKKLAFCEIFKFTFYIYNGWNDILIYSGKSCLNGCKWVCNSSSTVDANIWNISEVYSHSYELKILVTESNDALPCYMHLCLQWNLHFDINKVILQ